MEKKEQRVVISHVDNADFCTSGEDCEKKTQEIINYYEKMCKAKGGKVQKEKVSMCCWQWENQTIKEKPITIKLKDENIKQLKEKESIKMLGVFIHSNLNWDNKHEHVKTK